ncbi:MAG TPA: PAS domain S-box protein, partial [Planctomycetia bacterium]|nr:PAS domain S-box protein [Planctomycetia bacterium]
MPSIIREQLLRYGLAAASVIAATWIRLSLDPFLNDRFPFATLFFAVLLSAWYGGLGPALAATALGSFASAQYLLHPRYGGVSSETAEQGGLILYLIVGAGISFLGGVMHGARRRAESSAAEAARSRETAESSEFRYRQIVETAHEGVWVFDEEERTTFANERMGEILGCKAEEMIGRSAFDFLFAEDHPAARRLIEEHKARKRREFEFRHRRANGDEAWLHVSASPIFKGGKYAGALGLFTDVGGRRRTERKLQEQREWFKVTLASIGDAVIATDVEGKVTFVNGTAEALTGWSAEALAGRPVEEAFKIVHERTRSAVENPIRKALAEGSVVRLANHTTLVGRDGSERPIDDSAAPIK